MEIILWKFGFGSGGCDCKGQNVTKKSHMGMPVGNSGLDCGQRPGDHW